MLRKIPNELNGIFEISKLYDKYLGKDAGILENYYNFSEYKFIEDKLICKKIENSYEEVFKLIDIFYYINNLTKLFINKEKNIDEIILDLCVNLGVPKRYLVKETQDYYINEKYIKYCEACFKTFYNILSSKSHRELMKSLNDNYKHFPIFYRVVPNRTLITKYKSIPCSNNIFNLYFLTLMTLNFYTSNHDLKNPFICNECGGVFERKTNNQKYCDTCKSKINFSKVSRS